MRATVSDLSKFPGAGAYDTTGGSGAAGESASDHSTNFPSSSSPYNAAGAFSASHYGGFEGLKLRDRAARAAPAAPVSYVQIPGVQFTQHPANGFQQNAAPLAPASQVPYKLQYEARIKALAEAAKKEQQQGAPQAHYQYPAQHPPQVQPPPPYEYQYKYGQSQGARPPPAANATAQQSEAEAIQARMRYLAQKMAVYTDCWNSPIPPRFP